MPYLTSAEFSEIVAVADTIMHHLRTSGWQFVPAPNVGAALTQSRLAKTTITLKAVRQPFHSVQHIEANSGILLDIPNSYYTPSSATPQRVADIRRVILGALVHEFIHRLQDQESPSVFAVQLASQTGSRRCLRDPRMTGSTSTSDCRWNSRRGRAKPRQKPGAF